MAPALKGQKKVTVAIKVPKSYLSPFLFNSFWFNFFQIVRHVANKKEQWFCFIALALKGQAKVTEAIKVICLNL